MKTNHIRKLLSNPAYRGRHLIVVGGKVFTATNGKQALKILEKIHEEYPRQKISLAYVPKADTLQFSS